jgi:hypothetical protein
MDVGPVARLASCTGSFLAWNGSWNGGPGNPSTMSAVSAIFRGIGAASALGARGRGYGKETLRIDSVPRGACFPLPDSDGEYGAKFQPPETCSSSNTMEIRARRHRPQAQLRGQPFAFIS